MSVGRNHECFLADGGIGFNLLICVENMACNVCRKKKDQEIVLCHSCSEYGDETIKFIALGPHDKAYRIK